jgi:serine/threonine protein phosphatase PrpC
MRIFIYYILLFRIIFKITNIEKTCFLKLCSDGLKKLNKTLVELEFQKIIQTCSSKKKNYIYKMLPKH